MIAIPFIYVLWYLLSSAIGEFNLERYGWYYTGWYYTNDIFIWQAAYLLCMFVPLERLLTWWSRTS